ncbi:hypothetical protein ERO13_A11G152800v2 [Gossypium hirsutum]|uniref:Uncharacterized protein n=2 Tax=Gossypium TaxID=3633 RepID=A0A5D2X7B6_GOSMU|nr:hypothetical protein ERO13_A11G152800v2 [Gossypium hirsutum]TYI01043.1 hypothetical protein ES332_A11G173900v1 [Gossypium tomentosum]TYJ09829.1 hypothetical protein E1A91_A11G166500v1 [Gossypium mustelinum]
MQPPNHHRMVADDAQAKADFANGGELRLCPRRFGMADMAWTWYVGMCVVNGGGGCG